MKRTIFNPLADLCEATASAQVSTSALINEDVGICPKCKKPMGDASIANTDRVFYCEGCRVSTPRPDFDPAK